MNRRSVIRWYEGPPLFIEPPFPWVVVLTMFVCLVVGFLAGMFVLGVVWS